MNEIDNRIAEMLERCEKQFATKVKALNQHYDDQKKAREIKRRKEIF
jgi:hypothetical protein